MHSLSEIRNTLKNLPFYTEEIKSSKKNKKNINIKFLSELPFFYKKPKELTNKQLQKHYHSFQKDQKNQKDLKY